MGSPQQNTDPSVFIPQVQSPKELTETEEKGASVSIAMGVGCSATQAVARTAKRKKRSLSQVAIAGTNVLIISLQRRRLCGIGIEKNSDYFSTAKEAIPKLTSYPVNGVVESGPGSTLKVADLSTPFTGTSRWLYGSTARNSPSSV